MTSKLVASDLPDWPAVMGVELAAAYCGGHSENTFRAECPIPPFRRRGKDVWRRKDLDAWIDSWDKDGSESPDDFLSGFGKHGRRAA